MQHYFFDNYGGSFCAHLEKYLTSTKETPAWVNVLKHLLKTEINGSVKFAIVRITFARSTDFSQAEITRVERGYSAQETGKLPAILKINFEAVGCKIERDILLFRGEILDTENFIKFLKSTQIITAEKEIACRLHAMGL